MKNGKRLIALVLAALMTLMLLPMTAFAEGPDAAAEQPAQPVQIVEDESAAPVCTGDETCTLTGDHKEGCPKAVALQEETQEEVTYVAQVGENKYASMDEAITNANAGDTIQVLVNTIEFPAISKGGLTFKAAADGTQVTKMASTTLSGAGTTFDGFEFTVTGPSVAKDLTLKNCKFTGGNGVYYGACSGNWLIEGCEFNNSAYGLQIGEGSGTVNVNNCTFVGGFNTFGSGFDLTFTGCNFTTTGAKGGYAVFQTRGRMTIKDCKIDASWPTGANGGTFGSVAENAVTEIYNTTYGGEGSILDLSEDKSVGIMAVDPVKKGDKYAGGTFAAALDAAYIASGYQCKEDPDGYGYIVEEIKLTAIVGGQATTDTAAQIVEKAENAEKPVITLTDSTVSGVLAAAIGESEAEIELVVPGTAENTSVTFDKNAVAKIAETPDTVTLSVVQTEENVGAPETAVVYDITLVDSNNNTVAFDGGEATVELPLPDDSDTAWEVYYYNDGGKTDMDATVADGKATFTTSHFSTYSVEPVDESSEAAIDGRLYKTFQEAIDAATSGQTVTLLKAVSIAAQDDEPDTQFHVDADDNLVIDLGGHTVTGAFFVYSGGTATIKNGTVTNDRFVSGIESKGNLTVENLIVSTNRHGLRISGGTAVIGGEKTDVKTVASSNTCYALNTNGSVKVTVNGGKFTGQGANGSGAGCILAGGSDLIINGGEFINDGGAYNIGFYAGHLTITGGTFHATTQDTICIGGGDPNYGVSTEHGIQGGKFAGLTTSDTSLLAKGYAFVQGEDGWYTVDKAVASITSNAEDGQQNQGGYISLMGAIDAVNSNQTVTLLADIVNEEITLGNKSVTLDLAGYSLSSTAINFITLDQSKLTVVGGLGENAESLLKYSGTVPTGYTADLQTVTEGSNVTYSFGKTPITYNINYELNGGTGGTDAPKTHTYNTATTLVDPTRNGYTFEGWYTEAAFTNKVTVLSATGYTADITLYAKWTANTYTIAFDANGGSGTMDSISATYGSPVTLSSNAFTKTDMNFAGWALSADGQMTYADGEKVENLTAVNGGTVTLYAVWTNKEVLSPNTAVQTNPYNGKDQAFAANDADYTISYTLNGEAVQPKNVGTYDVKLVHAGNGTYAAYQTTVIGGLVIEKANLTATYQSEMVKTGQAPKLEVKVEGFVNGESADSALDYTAPTVTNTNTAVGTYDLIPTGGSAANYRFTYVGGTLTIQQAASEIEPTDAVKYIVEHHKAGASGYTVVDKEILDGKVGGQVTATPKQYAGYYYNADKSVASGTLVAISSDADIVTLKLYYDENIEYAIIEGANQTIESSDGAKFRSNAEFAKFVKVLLNGKELASANYTVREGSTIVELKPAFTKTLSAGKYTLTIVSTDGQASTSFVVKALSDDTTKPTEPDDTTKPTEPQETTKPSEPQETTKPTEPQETTKPTEPQETTKPTEPQETTKPTKPQETTPADKDDLLATGQNILPVCLLAVMGIALVFVGVFVMVKKRNGYYGK